MNLESLASRAVAAPGFAHMPGMLLMPVDGESHRLMNVGDCIEARDLGWPPDLSDPGTLGCIEFGLLPDAWSSCGDRVEIEVYLSDVLEPDGSLRPAFVCRAMWRGRSMWRQRWASDPCATRAEALVLALEAAP